MSKVNTIIKESLNQAKELMNNLEILALSSSVTLPIGLYECNYIIESLMTLLKVKCSQKCVTNISYHRNHPNALYGRREAKLGENNPNWKGGDGCNIKSLSSFHEYIRNHKPKPELCEDCGKVPPYDVANISGEYKRDLSDWKWICRRCHMVEDGRINNLKQFKVIGK